MAPTLQGTDRMTPHGKKDPCVNTRTDTQGQQMDAGPGTDRAPRTVAVCVATFRRPKLLAQLLDSLARQDIPDTEPVRPVIIVADNGVSPEVETLVTDLAAQCPWPVRYVPVPDRGLASARNAALEAAPGEAAFIAFIDDDEIAHPGWLAALIATADHSGADLVLGPVEPRFPDNTPAWAAASGLFALGPFLEGTPIKLFSGGNCLIRAGVVRNLGFRFDTRLNRAGSEDQLFALQALDRGCRIVTSATAVVTEIVPPDRLSRIAMMKRHYRIGTTSSDIDRILGPSGSRPPLRAAKGLVRIAGGLGGWFISPFQAPGAGARALCRFARGVGEVAGVFGIRYRPYGKS